MKSNSIVAATRQSAAIFPRTSRRRFPKRRYSGLATFALFLLTSACCPRARAQSYSVDWYKIAGGGGTSTGGVYSVSGTIGQPEAGSALSGGNYSVTGGFWSHIAVVQTPGAPLLTITLTNTNTAMVSWPSPSTGWSLQQNNDLSPANWVAGPAPVDNGVIKYIIVNPPSGNRFYRLKQ